MSLYKTFQTDKELESRGVLVEYGMDDNGNPIRFRVCRAGGANSPYAKKLEATYKPYRRALNTETMDEKLADKLLKEVFFGTVVTGWENVTDENGQKLDFNKENFVKLMTDLPDLWADIRQQSMNISLYRTEELKADAKN